MLQVTTQLPFSAKIISPYLPPPKKSSSREREYLRTDEVKSIIRAAIKVGRYGVRDERNYFTNVSSRTANRRINSFKMDVGRFGIRLHRNSLSQARSR